MGEEGSGDRRVQAYNFRMCTTDVPENRLDWVKPANYDERWFELALRNVEAGDERISWAPTPMPNRKTDTNNNFAVSTDFIGQNWDYPDADYATRARIWKADQEFMRGMTHFLRTDDCVPDKFKQLAAELGFQRGIFDETGGWPHQLYVREARRMRSEYVLTQKDLEGSTNPEDSIGLASYGVDDWPYATYALDGKVALYGGEFSMLYLDSKHEGIYKIPYRVITPKQSECTNLLVPVCVSASHIAMTSIRMEPVWMILGESAGVAAAMAVTENTPVQRVPYAGLQVKLLALKQKLA